MKILIVGDIYSVHTFNFVKQTLLHINDINKIVVWNIYTETEKKEEMLLFYKNHDIDIVQEEPDSPDKFCNLRAGFEKIKEFGMFDVCHLHYLGYMAVTAGLLVRTLCGKLISNYWGSDWLRADNVLKDYQKYLLDVSDDVVTDSLQIHDQLNEYFKSCFDEKIKYIRFKMPVIDEIQSEGINECVKRDFMGKYHIPSDKVIVTCGYSASISHNHKGIIKAIKKITEKEKVFVIIPMTYGKSAGYTDEIKRDLKESACKGIIIEGYMSYTEVALLRLITDIFINVEETDAYSSTMVEYTYCNKIVIIGQWLDYSELEKQGAYYEKIGEIGKLKDKLEEVLKNFNAVQIKFENNRRAIKRFQLDNDRNELWEFIYREESPVSLRPSIFANIENKIKRWSMQNKYQMIGIYGMGLLGAITYQIIADVTEEERIYVFDRAAETVSWCSKTIWKPQEVYQKELDVLIITATVSAEKIKEEFCEKIPSHIFTYAEWLTELENI